jgi:hypothetical protein
MFNFDTTKTFNLIVLVPNVEFDVSGNDLDEPDTTLDPAAWNAATPYVAGDQVYSVKRIYQRLVDGTTATAPASDEVNWVYVSLCNRFKMFDPRNSTQTIAPGGVSASFTYRVIVAAGDTFDWIVFDALDGIATLRLRVFDNTGAGAALEDSTVTLVGHDAARPWATRKAWAFQGLDGDDVLGSVIQVDVTPNGSEVPAIGCMSIGTARELGIAMSGFNVGIVDRSVKDEDEFGNMDVVERTYSKRMSGTLALESSAVDAVTNLLADYRAEVAMYVATGGSYSATTMLGYYKSFEMTVQGPVISYCFIDVEGL